MANSNDIYDKITNCDFVTSLLCMNPGQTGTPKGDHYSYGRAESIVGRYWEA